jgi:hypothetical protein
MYDGSKIEVLKAAITEVHPATAEEAAKADKDDDTESKKVEISNAKDS